MKINHKTTSKTTGEIRIVTRFLLFPKRIGDQTRWLETARWSEIRKLHPSTPLEGEYWYWEADQWLDSEYA